MVLAAETAADLMTLNPKSIGHRATVDEAMAFLAGRGISAAPVIDDAGRPIGVVSRSDVLIRKRHGATHLMAPRPVFSENGSVHAPAQRGTVRDIMTPAIFCVASDTPAAKVVKKMLGLKVRRLFVVDGNGVLVGVISTFDVLRKLRKAAS
jgi:CBS domain-containing protein